MTNLGVKALKKHLKKRRQEKEEMAILANEIPLLLEKCESFQASKEKFGPLYQPPKPATKSSDKEEDPVVRPKRDETTSDNEEVSCDDEFPPLRPIERAVRRGQGRGISMVRLECPRLNKQNAVAATGRGTSRGTVLEAKSEHDTSLGEQSSRGASRGRGRKLRMLST